MNKKVILLIVCTMVITFSSVFNALAWELVDRDGDGVEESVRLCNGEYDDLERYMGYTIGGENPGQPVLSTTLLDSVDELAKKPEFSYPFLLSD